MILCIIFIEFPKKTVKKTKEKESEIVMDNKNNILISAITIAKYIVAFCSGQNPPISISNIKLQKLLYLVFGEYSLDHSDPLFPDTFQAWEYGPVVADVYDEFCAFAGSYIRLAESGPELPDNITLAINPTIEANMKRDVFDLVDETHQPGSAWDKAFIRNNGTIKNHPEILMEDIIEEFRKRRSENDKDSTHR